MTTQLHILVRPPDPLVQALLNDLAIQPELRVECVDLTQPDPNYARLVEQIFAADAVATW